MDKLKKLLNSPLVRGLATAVASGSAVSFLGLAHPVTVVVAVAGVVLTVTAAKKK
jgi:hypothetical protein